MNDQKLTQLLPVMKDILLEGSYLAQGLADMSARIQRPLVITNFLTDKNGVIAKAVKQHEFQVPPELKNPSDWRLFQELMAQADVIISGAAYLQRMAVPGFLGQEILFQFEAGREFAELGEWRIKTGYKKKSPDVAVVARRLDFHFPEELIRSGRRIFVFTSQSEADSEEARALKATGVTIVGSGKEDVDGNTMINFLSNGLGYRVIMMATGPGVLDLLLTAKRLDLLYVTEVQVEIPFDGPDSVQTMLSGNKKVNELQEFILTHQYLQKNVSTEDGSITSQFFLRYDRKDAYL
jgi:riboflavin biosynthesis pyrimidine reductase